MWCTSELFGCYMAGATWNCCCLGTLCVYTTQPCTVYTNVVLKEGVVFGEEFTKNEDMSRTVKNKFEKITNVTKVRVFLWQEILQLTPLNTPLISWFVEIPQLHSEVHLMLGEKAVHRTVFWHLYILQCMIQVQCDLSFRQLHSNCGIWVIEFVMHYDYYRWKWSCHRTLSTTDSLLLSWCSG